MTSSGSGPGTHTTLVLVTHHLHEAVRLGDRLAILLDGRIRQCDVPERVMASPVDAEVAALVQTEARVRGHVVASEDGLVVVDTGAGSGRDVEGRARRLLDANRTRRRRRPCTMTGPEDGIPPPLRPPGRTPLGPRSLAGRHLVQQLAVRPAQLEHHRGHARGRAWSSDRHGS